MSMVYNTGHVMKATGGKAFLSHHLRGLSCAVHRQPPARRTRQRDPLHIAPL